MKRLALLIGLGALGAGCYDYGAALEVCRDGGGPCVVRPGEDGGQVDGGQGDGGDSDGGADAGCDCALAVCTGVLCRPQLNACDAPEVCGGGVCPPDRLFPTGTTCTLATCSNSTFTPASACDVAGNCIAFAPQSCGNFGCGPTACNTTCTTANDCAAQSYCQSGSCVPQVPNGTACTGTAQCLSGLCVDGVCCDTSCVGGCNSCALGTDTGTCTVTPQGSAGTAPVCAPFVCNGVGADCPTLCTTASDCTSGFFCSGQGQCVPMVAQGGACTGSGQCMTAQCVDGVCCDTACAGGCDTCNASGSLGTCTTLAFGAPGTSPSCAPFLCNGAAATCPTTCTANSNCVAGSFCDTPDAGPRTCTGQQGDGQPCASASQCLSNLCVDGVCCNSACAGACDVCNGNTLGTCAPAPGTTGSPSCGAYVCGATAACPTNCVNDVNCAPGAWCSSGTCVPRAVNGTGCAAGNRCLSGLCVDNVCCDGTCAGACDSCIVMGSIGTCAPTPGAGGTPSCSPFLCGASLSCPASCASDNDCTSGAYCNGASRCVARLALASACFADNECQSGHCVDGYCCSASCTGACESCNLAGSLGTCAPELASSAGSPSCSPYVCDGATSSCPSACTTNAHCINGNYCTGVVCLPRQANGTSCTEANQCSSGLCVDGYCCSSTCSGACDFCNLSGAQGTCGNAVAGTASTCSPYVCDGSASCATACTTDASCASTHFCNGTACLPRAALGTACTGDAQCASLQCVDGLCCDVACTGTCNFCNLAGTVGTCTPAPIGTPSSCSPFVCAGAAGCPTTCSTDAACAAGYYCSGTTCVARKNLGATCAASNECSSTFCADGVCCGSACGAACDSCNLAGSVGTCTIATGAPSCGAYLCAAAATCPSNCATNADCASGNYCNGSSCLPRQGNGTLCTATNQCTSGHCVDGRCCDSACSAACDFCDLAGSLGTCSNAGAGTVSTCSPYACVGGANCATSCTTDSSCAAGYYCSGSSCVPKLNNGTACTTANQCTSNNCVDGLCCTSACSGACDFCNLGGTGGVCTVQSGGAGSPSCGSYVCGSTASCPNSCTSDAQCSTSGYCNGTTCVAKKAAGLACGGANQCTSGFCANGTCCTTACAGGCATCTTGTCGTLPDGNPGANPVCAPYLCNGGSLSCPSNCVDNTDCVGTSYCTGSSQCFGKVGNGASCSLGSECISDNCIDGVCCDTLCSGSCNFCNLASSVGTCANAPAGTVSTCSPYVCGGGVNCPSTCSVDANCAAGNYCSGGACVAKQANAVTCGANNQCLSGQCADGVCCNAACTGACNFCNLSGNVGNCLTAPAGTLGNNPSCLPYLCNGSSASCPSTCSGDTSCAAGNYCSGGTCVPKLAQGTSCSAGNQCSSGSCVDGYCCSSACTGSCNACSVALGASANGACTAVAVNTDPKSGCGNFTCNGSGACATSCSGGACSVNCKAGAWCNGSTCSSDKATGSNTCSNNCECTSGNCVDGYCCNSSCGGGCDRCNGTTLGTCSLTPAGNSGANPACTPYACSGSSASCPGSCTTDANCATGNYCNGTTCVAKLAQGAVCATANQCSSGFCADGYCCSAACSGGCQTCKVSTGAPANGTCGNITVGTDPKAACPAAYNCSGAGACATTCNSPTCGNASCKTGYYCNGTSCVAQKATGANTCTVGCECASGNCVDGYCCNSACTGTCTACNRTGSLGTCSNHPIGTDPSAECGNYVCSGAGACYTSCSAPPCATQCNSTSAYCSGTACVPKLVNGVTGCTATCQCVSGSCPTFYRDADSDSFGNSGVTQRACGTSPPSGYTTTSTDCCDSDANAFPGATVFRTTARAVCGGFDYNCDGASTQEFTTLMSGCSGPTTSCPNYWYDCVTTGFVAGWATQSGGTYRYVGASSVPACGVGGTYVAACSSSNYSFPCGTHNYCSYTPLGGSLSRAQGCR